MNINYVVFLSFYPCPTSTGTSFTYTRKQVFRVACDWRYAMFLHEYPETDRKHLKEGNLQGNYNINSRRLGARNKTIRKYLKDALRFEKALDLEMTRKRKSRFFTRMLFYCANSWYDDAGLCANQSITIYDFLSNNTHKR